MEMTVAEIVRNYQEAKNKKKQVGILAQLNACSQGEIIEILRASGIDGRELPRSRKPRQQIEQSDKNTANGDDATFTSRQRSVIGAALLLYRSHIIQEAEAARIAHDEHMAKLDDEVQEIDKLLQITG